MTPPFSAARSPVLALLAPLAAVLALAPAPFARAGCAPSLQEPSPASAERAAAVYRPEKPSELFEVVRVVDGDTLHVQRGGELVKLRLLSVDTEEKLSNNPNASATKPETVFGEQCALWAQEFFAKLGQDGRPARVGLAFPDGREALDVYGRLLCHVILPDGRDFNLLLVELGKSPYFNKYGNSRICHAAFVKAQEQARAKGLGIWNPKTNVPETSGAPSAVRPYERLMPWWQARADAVDDYREKHAAEPLRYVNAEEPETLAAALGKEVEAFGSIDRLFDEENGEWTVLMRSGDKRRALRLRVRAEHREAFASFDVAGLNEEFRQNFVWVRGRLEQGPRGFEIWCESPAAWRVAEPQYRESSGK